MAKDKRKNHVFYMSDIETVPDRGHFTKMDKEKDIAALIERQLDYCKVSKSIDYDGELICGDSLGLIFPVHSYGISIAVYSFISRLRVAKGTYVYAVCVGEKLDVAADTKRLIASLEKRGLGGAFDVYVRCKNIRRDTAYTEEILRQNMDTRSRIETVMRGILCYSVGRINNENTVLISEAKRQTSLINSAYDLVLPEVNNVVKRTPRLSNVFLDEDMLAGVRLCRVM